MPFAITWHDKQRERERDWERERERVEIVRRLVSYGLFSFSSLHSLGCCFIQQGSLSYAGKEFYGQKGLKCKEPPFGVYFITLYMLLKSVLLVRDSVRQRMLSFLDFTDIMR